MKEYGSVDSTDIGGVTCGMYPEYYKGVRGYEYKIADARQT
jgi:hypothetical protein